uniref:Uncharacterized LOC105932503 n=1 Tax=Fundulus heteroclitus TaxID=8078 RepID=A0A3Q2QD95_FUNHE
MREAVKQRAMQSPPEDHRESNPVAMAAAKHQQDAEAPPTQSNPAEQEEEADTPEAAAAPAARTAEPPPGLALTPPPEKEAGVHSQTESRDNAGKADTEPAAKPRGAAPEPVADTKTSPGDDGQKEKKQAKRAGDGRKYVLSKKAMIDPLKMDMTKPVVMPLTSSQLSLHCIECHIIFSDHKSKERHMKQSHPAEYEQCILRNSLFACYVCDRHFTNSAELMAHQKAHPDKKPFKCPICDLAFKRSSELTNHKKIHFGEDGYACNECGKPCKTLTLLKYHQRTHSGEMPFVCKDCGERFSLPNVLMKHIKSHSSEGAEGGGAGTESKATKKKKENDGRKLYLCSVCKAPFKSPKTRLHHMKTKHKLAAVANPLRAGLQGKQSVPIITPISISQPALLQVEANGRLQKVDANIDTEQLRKLIERMGNVQKVNQVVILGQVPPHAPPLEVQQVSEPAGMVHLNLGPPQIDFIGLKPAESKTVQLDPSVNPMEQTIILEPITPEGQLENPSFSDLGSHVAGGEHVELTLVPAEVPERLEGEATSHQSLQQPGISPGVCHNDVADLKENLEQTVILELTPALIPAEELEQSQPEPQSEVASSALVQSTEQETPDQAAGHTVEDPKEANVPAPPLTSTVESILTPSHPEKQVPSSGPSPPPERPTSAPSESEATSKGNIDPEKVGLDQMAVINEPTKENDVHDLCVKCPTEDKSSRSEGPGAKEGALAKLEPKEDQQRSELPVSVMSAQELVKVRKRKPARTFFFQGYMHDLVGSIYKDDFQIDAKPAKRQRTKKSCLVVKFGPQNKDKKCKKQKKPEQERQPIQDSLIKNKTPVKKSPEKVQKVPTPKKTGKGKKEKTENMLPASDIKSPSSHSPPVKQVKEDAKKTKVKKQKETKVDEVHIREEKPVDSPTKSPKELKGKKNMSKGQNVKKTEATDSNINQDSLLLLKGHKQPQLKVYKLDTMKASGPTQEDSPQDSQSTEGLPAAGKKKGGRTQKNQKGLSLLSSLQVTRQQPPTAPAKPKTTRKRKAPPNVETEGVITSKRALECKDCGERFSEVASLQKHKTTAHVIESPGLTYTNGNVFEGVSGFDLYRLPKEHMGVVRVLNAPTDWDTEPDMGEMALEDPDRGVSFPALIPSPSLQIPPQEVGTSTHEHRSDSKTGTEDHFGASCELQSSPDVPKDTEARPNVTAEASSETVTSDSREPAAPDEDKQEDVAKNQDEDVKEDLLLEVDLVTVGEQQEERADPVPQNEPSRVYASESEIPGKDPGPVSSETREVSLASQTASCSAHRMDVKEEEEETLVQKRKDTGNEAAAAGQSRRAAILNRDWMSGTSSGVELEHEPEECQIVYEKPLSSDLEAADRGISTERQTFPVFKIIRGTPPAAPLPPARADVAGSSEEAVASEPGSLNSIGSQGREERESDRSPGIILERVLTSTQRATSDGEADAATGSRRRPEVRLFPLPQENACFKLIGLRFIILSLQKAEHRSVSHGFGFLFSATENGETAKDCRLPPDFNSNQCIFYPVKVEEREVLLGASHTSTGSSSPDGSGNAEPSDLQSADCNARQYLPQKCLQTPFFLFFFFYQILNFNKLSDQTDERRSSPASYQESYLRVKICFFFRSLPNSESRPPAPHVDNSTAKPVDYFSEYFSWDTWGEIASCTNEASRRPNPVTGREVARFVGIHIAMGTLKFPSARLYWEDVTKVPLIAEAMPLSRFLELSRVLKLASSNDPRENVPGQQPGGTQRSVASERGDRRCSADPNGSQTQADPLRKVRPLLSRFNAGCRSLRQRGDYAVDQYPLALTGKLHDNRPSLHCTTLMGLTGLIAHVDLELDPSETRNAMEETVPEGSTLFLCKQELSTPATLERLSAAGIHGAGRVGGARGQIGDEFVSSDGKLMLRRTHCGFLLSTAGNGQRNMLSLIDSFEKAQISARLVRDLQNLYSSPLTVSSPAGWPQAVLWHLADVALVNSWLLYRRDHGAASAPLTLMAFRLEVSKALILSSGSDAQDSIPPQPPEENAHRATSEAPSPVLLGESPLPDAATRYDGSGHWPEQLAEGEGGRCRFGDCQRTSRVLCLKCCVFLCISRNHNCFLNFHNQESLGKEH